LILLKGVGTMKDHYCSLNAVHMSSRDCSKVQIWHV